MDSPGLPLRELILLARQDVQQVIEYLASPVARRVAPGRTGRGAGGRAGVTGAPAGVRTGGGHPGGGLPEQ